MRPFKVLTLALVLAAAIVPALRAHTLEELGSELRERERYFQPIARPAPGFTLQDAEGRRMSLADLRGRVVVLHFIYASCPDVCPLHAEKVAEIQEMVNITPMRELVRFVTITTDPARDTAAVMRDYGPAHGLDPANWLFLTTLPGQPEDTTRQLAEAFGHKFTPTDDGMQMHGIVTHVVDQEGVWRANFHGLKFEPTSLVIQLNALINGAHTSHPHARQGLWERLRALFGV